MSTSNLRVIVTFSISSVTYYRLHFYIQLVSLIRRTYYVLSIFIYHRDAPYLFSPLQFSHLDEISFVTKLISISKIQILKFNCTPRQLRVELRGTFSLH